MSDELYSPDLDWFLTQRDVECGWRTNFGGFVAMLERGGPGAGVDSSDPYHEVYVSRLATFERDRRLSREWAALTFPVKRILRAHYAHAVVAGFWRGVGGALGKLAGSGALVAFDAGELGPMLAACSNPTGEGSTALIERVRERAEAGAREAHRAYYSVTSAVLDAWVA